MDKLRQKSKKDKPMKHVDKDKSTTFITDVKTIKENLKIREILRTVKMNSSMRLKAPRGSMVMQNKDFHENEDLFDETTSNEEHDTIEPPSALNPDVVVNNTNIDTDEATSEECANSDDQLNKEIECTESDDNVKTDVEAHTLHKSNSLIEGLVDFGNIDPENETITAGEQDIIVTQNAMDSSHVKTRDRKLSLDNTMLSRREGLSQSELDLHSIGKSPLERKSSFFRKKMDSFLKNTTEIFKRQSFQSKSQGISRRGSMSVSLQSLNEKSACTDDYDSETINKHHDELQGSEASLESSLTASSLSIGQSDRGPLDVPSEEDSLTGSRQGFAASQSLVVSSNSIQSLNEAYIQDAILNRAISMSSGLDSAQGRRKASRSNRVTWLASEGLTNYFRRVIQDEKSKEMQVCHSYQDFSTIPEKNLIGPKLDSKGRRLSYQRAVSGEDPVLPMRYQDSSLRRKHLIPENSEANDELSNYLAEYSRHGVPPLKGFTIAPISAEAFAYLRWAEQQENLQEFFNDIKMTPHEEARQAVISELVTTEAVYIRHLITIVDVFIAAAHDLQDRGKLLDFDTAGLFSNIPDVLNSSLNFWESTIFPMLEDAMDKKIPFNTDLMAPGFWRIRDLFQPYEKYVSEQTKALDYLRSLSNNADFLTYISWCHGQKSCNRLQLSDIMVKPMQRLTKYSIIIHRIISLTDTEPERSTLVHMETLAKAYVLELNRYIRQREELEKIEELSNIIDGFEMDFKDEDMDRCFRMYSGLNLKAPMVNCLPMHSRTLIHEGDLRFRDSVKEIEVRAFLLTDMLLICKKLSKGSPYAYKMIRPKIMVDKMVPFPKYSPRSTKDVITLIYVLLDEVSSSFNCFALLEPTKDPSAQGTLRIWEQKIREARLSYELSVWSAKNPSRNISEAEIDSCSDYSVATCRPGGKQSSEDINIEREARERVATMLHRNHDPSTDGEYSTQISMTTDSFDGEMSAASGIRTPGKYGLRHPMQRTSTGGSSRNSRLSSFQKSISAASHDEPQLVPGRYNYGAGTSVEHHYIPPQKPDDPGTSITVLVVSESESETVVPSPQTPVVVLEQPPPHKTPPPRSHSSCSHSTLRVQPQSGVMALVHSLPDLTLDPTKHKKPRRSPRTQSASEKLYQSHQELLQRNRLSASQQRLPDHRGTSYPPPSPTRSSLKRGIAFSHSFRHPPLLKVGHVNSQSQAQCDPGPSTSQATKSDKAISPSSAPVPGMSSERAEPSQAGSSSRKNGSSSTKPNGTDKE